MKQSGSNLKTVGLKKSISSQSLITSPNQQQNQHAFQQANNLPKAQVTTSQSKLLNHQVQYYDEDAGVANISIGTCDKDQRQTNQNSKEMAQQQRSVFPVNAAGFNSISSIASEGLNHNFTSVQSIQTKNMMQNLTTASLQLKTGDESLDRLLEQTVMNELANHAQDRQSQEAILVHVHSLTQQAGMDKKRAQKVLQHVANQLCQNQSQNFPEETNLNGGIPEKLNKDLMFDFTERAASKKNKGYSKKPRKSSKNSKSRSSSTMAKAPSASSKRKSSSQVSNKRSSSKVVKKSSGKTSMNNTLVSSSLNDTSILLERQKQDESNNYIIDTSAVIEVDQSQLSIEPTKLTRLDFGSIISAQKQSQVCSREEYQTLGSVGARAASPQMMDCMLSASVYNGDKPMPLPPKTKPVTLGSLNFSTLKSHESKTSRGSQSFQLPRLTLDESLNRSVEKLIKKDSEKKKQKFSPYRSNSHASAREVALNALNASVTSTSALKLRQYTKTQARPLSARTSTPIVPKPGKQRAMSRSNNHQKPNTSRPPVAAPTKPTASCLKPPQPINKQKKTKKSDRLTDCGASQSTQITYTASMPTNLKRASSMHSQRSSNNESSHRINDQTSLDSHRIQLAVTAPGSNHNDYSMTHGNGANGSSLLNPMITSKSHSQQMIHNSNYGSVSHRLNATTTAGSETNQGYSSHEVPSFRTQAAQEQPAIQCSQTDDAAKTNLELQIETQAANDNRTRNNIKRSSNNEYTLEKNFVTFNQYGDEQIVQVHQKVSLDQSNTQDEEFRQYLSSINSTQLKPTNDVSKKERQAIRFAQHNLMQKSMTQWTRMIQVQHQKCKLAKMFHRSRLVANVVQKWRSLKHLERERSQKARLRLAQVMPYFENSIKVQDVQKAFKAMKRLTISESAFDLFRLNQLKKCWQMGLVVYTANQLQKKAVRRDLAELYQGKLMAKTLVCLSEYKRSSQHKAMLNDLAKEYYKQHSGIDSKKKAYDALVSYAITAKQSQQAKQQNRFSLLYKAFISLVDYSADRRKTEQQKKLITSFYRCSLASRTLKAFSSNVESRKEARSNALDTFQRQQQALCFQKLKAFSRRQQCLSPQKSGLMLQFCQIWMQHSFGKVMLNVWKDYPKQELKVDPENGQTLLVKNYLALSKHGRRGMGFYLESNKNYREYLQNKVIDLLYMNAYTKKQKLRQFHQDRLSRMFTAFRRVCGNYRVMRAFREDKVGKDDRELVVATFSALFKTTKKMNLLKQCQEQQAQKVCKRNKKLHLREWATLTRKKKALAKCEQVSQGIDRDRTLTKYLALWLSKLHLKLKKTHLKKLQLQFYEAKTKAKMMEIWLKKHERNVELEVKDQTIASMQERQLLQKCISAMKQFTKSQALISRKKAAADQEYIWWLGKRVMANLRRYFNRRRACKEMSQFVVSDYQAAFRKKVFSALKLFTQFHGQRRRADQIILDQICLKQKHKVLKEWTSLYSQRVGARLLTQSLDACTKRLTLLQIRRVGAQQETHVALFKDYAPMIQLQSCFTAFKKHAWRQRYHRYIQQKLQQERLDRLYQVWRSSFLVEQAKIDFFNKTLICYKNNIARRAYMTLALHSLKGRLKKRADVHRYSSILRKVLDSFRKSINMRNRSICLYQEISEKHRQLTLQGALANWNGRFVKRSNLRNAQSNFGQSRLQKLYMVLKAHMQTNVTKKANVSQLKTQLAQIKAKHGLKKFRNITLELAQSRFQSEKARAYHAQYVFKSVVQFWFQHYKRNQALFGQLKRFKTKMTKTSKHQALSHWISQSKKALERVKAASHSNQMLNRIHKRRYLRQWIEETNFLMKLDSVQRDAIVKYRRVKAAKALRHFSQVTQALVFEREKREQTQAYADRKRMVKTFTELYRYKEQRLKQTDVKMHALALHTQNTLISAFAIFRKGCDKQKLLREAVRQMQQRQVQKFQGPKVMAQWRKRLDHRLKIRDQKLTADEFDQLRLLRCSFNGLLANMLTRRDKYFLKSKADSMRDRKLLDRGVRALLLYLCKRKDKQEKETLAVQQLETIQECSVVKQVFGAFKRNLKLAKIKNQKATEHFRQVSFVKCWTTLIQNCLRRRNLHHLSSQISAKRQASVQHSTFSKWQEAVVIHRAFTAANQTYQIKLASKCFSALYTHYESSKKLKIASQVRHVTAAVKAFESLKKNVLICRVKRDLSVQALVHRAEKLKQKGVKAFCIVINRKALVSELQAIRLHKIAQKTFTAWEDKHQLKLWRKDALQMCRLIMTKRALRQWRHQTNQALQIERASVLLSVSKLAKGWHALKLASYRSKCVRYMQNKVTHSQVKDVFCKWQGQMQPEQIKARILFKKLATVLKMDEHFNAIKSFNETDQALTLRTQHLVSKRIQRQKFELMKTWAHSMRQSQAITSLNTMAQKVRKLQAFDDMRDHAIDCQEEQSSLYDIINLFSQRRPQNLLLFQKAFLHLSVDQQTPQQPETRICRATLAKYVFEKWRNVLPKLHRSKEQDLIAKNHYRQFQLRQVFGKMASYSKQIRQQSCISIMVTQTHEDNMLKQVFVQLRNHAHLKIGHRNIIQTMQEKRQSDSKTAVIRAWQQISARKASLRELAHSFSFQREQNQTKKYLSLMRASSLQARTDESIILTFDQQRNRSLSWQVLQILHNYAKCQGARRNKDEKVIAFRKRTLMKRGILSLKLSHSWKLSKYNYSRLFTVFTAWKTQTKENNLLNKYLAQCGQLKRGKMMNQSHTIEQMGGGSSSKKRRDADHLNTGEMTETEDVFSAGHELVFQAVGQLSFADSVMVDYKSMVNEPSDPRLMAAKFRTGAAQQIQDQHSTILAGSERMGLTDLYDDDAISSRDNNFLFGCKPSGTNVMKGSRQRRFGGETSSDDDYQR